MGHNDELVNMKHDTMLTTKEFRRLTDNMSREEKLALYTKLKAEEEQSLSEEQRLINTIFDDVSECLTDIRNIWGL